MDELSAKNDQRKGKGWPFAVGLVVLLAIVGQVVVRSGERVLSQNYTDLVQQFIPWREFGFGEIGRGNIPLWNPHNYSGNPFVGNFQSALFYPPNWVHLVLPMGWAINLLFVFHLMVAYAGMARWAGHRGLGRAGAGVAGAVFVLGGAYWLHVYPGHLPFLSTACWTPWVMLGVQKLVEGNERRRTAWWLAGVVGLQCLGGYPQPVYMTALAAGALALGPVVERSVGRQRGVGDVARAAGWTTLAYALGAGLAAVQLAIGLWTTKESVRAGGTTFEYSSSFSLPPENFLLAAVPTLMGDLQTTGYSGRWLMWEVTPYFGVAAVILAVIGFAARRPGRWLEVGLLAVFVVLALGGNTPMHRVLYEWLPMYSSFRVPARFLYIAGMFVGLGAGWGVQRLLLGEVGRWQRGVLGAGCLVMASVLAYVGWGLVGGNEILMGWWGGFRDFVLASRESGQPEGFFRDGLDAATGRGAGMACLIFAGVWGVSGTALLLSGRQAMRWAVPAVAVVELAVVGWWFVASAPVQNEYPEVFEQAAARLTGGERVMHTVPIHRNEALVRGRSTDGGMLDVWGYDQVVLLRYAQFMAAVQGFNPALASADVPMVQAHPLLGMLRCLYTLEMTAEKDPRAIVRRVGGRQLPRALVLGRAEVHATLDGRFRRMFDGNWDPGQVVLLEEPALPLPSEAAAGAEVRVSDLDTDRMMIEVEMPGPGVLLVTDSYSAGWVALGVHDGVEREYDVVPANHTLRALVLEAGRHKIEMVYRPTAWTVGVWITAAAAGVWVGWGCWSLRLGDRRFSGVDSSYRT